MAVLRSRRLEAVLGAPLDTLEPQHLNGLVSAGVREAFDLDFKQALYGRGDSDKRALASDVAALANTAGGLIVLGVEEDTQARAVATPGVELSDAEVARMRQAIASNTAPMPAVDILTIEDPAMGTSPDGAVRGYIVIAVPRSPSTPHAVLVNDALRYPTRNGATTRYLSEPEVATAYRNRFALAQQQTERIEEIESEAIDRLAADDRYAWCVVSLVPDLSGEMDMSRESYADFAQRARETSPTVVPAGLSFHRTRVGRRRFRADGTVGYEPHARFILMELHSDGSGVFAMAVGDMNHPRTPPATVPEEQGQPRGQLVEDEAIATAILSGLAQLGYHARDRAGAGGTALVRAQLHPVSPQQPTAIGHARHYGIPEFIAGEHWETQAAPAEVAASLDDLGQPGPGLTQAAALLLHELGQAFGVTEMWQLTRDGVIRRRYWGQRSGRQAPLVAWAHAHGIDVTDATADG
ncbi:ATP-binding protein [Micromonospora aurantiaca]|uniref:AlbA family DNA-binding domain-containing protein n=1 Tax=Micromonospora aurantiaca (nom. illeg.) TaxID=47850 RepID=UPI002E17DDDB